MTRFEELRLKCASNTINEAGSKRASTRFRKDSAGCNRLVIFSGALDETGKESFSSLRTRPAPLHLVLNRNIM